jgi:hypothetical protein
MKSSQVFLLALSACAGLMPAFGQVPGPFDGTWKAQMDSVAQASPPDEFELRDGVFRCRSCAPGYEVRADGADQTVAGHRYFDTISVQVVGPREVVRTSKLHGTLIARETLAVSDDGNTLTTVIDDRTGAKPVIWTQVSTRVAPASNGDHALSGSWKVDKMPGASDAAITVVYHDRGDRLQMDYNGLGFDAGFDGKPVPMHNDPGGTSVALKRPSPRVIEETDTRDGKVTTRTTLTVSDDGSRVDVVMRDVARDTVTSYRMVRAR